MNTSSTDHAPRIEINIAQIRRNWQALSSIAGRPLVPVLKANAYGHGLRTLAEAAPFGRPPFLAVAQPDDALSLRRWCATTEILCLGPVTGSQMMELASQGIMITVTSLPQLRRWLHPGAQERPRAHLQLDTGLGRLGVREVDISAVLDETRAAGAEFAGLLTHPASADDGDWVSVREELESASQISARLRTASVLRGPDHFGATSCIVAGLETLGDIARCGIGLFGHLPGAAADGAALDVRSALRFLAQLVGVREVDAGERIGYGGQVQLGSSGRVGIVNVGVAHGLSPGLAQGGNFAIGTVPLPILAIYLDYTLVDVSHVPVDEGDDVVVLDDAQNSPASVARQAATLGVIVDHVLAPLSESIPRRTT